MDVTQVSTDTGAEPLSASKHNATLRRLSRLLCSSQHLLLVTARSLLLARLMSGTNTPCQNAAAELVPQLAALGLE